MDEQTTHGPARRLVEDSYNCGIYGATGMESIEREADQHDAQFAALVEAAEGLYALVDRGTELDWHDGYKSAMQQLRAALKAVEDD